MVDALLGFGATRPLSVKRARAGNPSRNVTSPFSEHRERPVSCSGHGPFPTPPLGSSTAG